ncbi:MAG: STT3 domain-containing protein [Parcubacteria group bacterium]
MFQKIKKIYDRFVSFLARFDFIEQRVTWQWTLALIILAYAFSVGIRFIWIFAMKNVPDAFWNGQLIPTTHDAFYWGSIVQKALWGLHESNRLVPGIFGGEYAHLLISFFLVKFLNISLEAIMIYLPIFVSGIIVVPIILIGRLYKNTFLGWCAALLACAASSFYNRTLAGYFDTDMFSLFLVVLILYFLLAAIEKGELKYAYFGAVASLVAPIFYLKITPILYAIVAVYIIYNLIWRRKEKGVWESILILTFIFWSGNFLNYLNIGALNVGWLADLVLVSIIYKIIRHPRLSRRAIACLALISIILFLVLNSPLQSIYSRVYQYASRGIAQTDSAGKLFYLSKVGTISEAQTLPYKRFAAQLIGSQIAFYLAILGYVLLIVRRPSFLLSLPLAGLALFSFAGGLRFVMYGAPIVALSIVYLLYLFFMWLLQKNVWKEKKIIICLVVLFISIITVYPSVKYIKTFIAPPVIYRNRITALDALKKQADPQDYVITWWDYGSLIWFYSGLQTVSAPSAQGDGASMFLVSEILTSNYPAETANLGRWMVEKYVDYYSRSHAEGEFFDFFGEEAFDPNEFLASTRQSGFILPPKTRNVYLYLPLEMLGIAFPISEFSNINLATGDKLRQGSYVISARYAANGKKIFMPEQNVTADFGDLTLTKSNGQNIPVKAFYQVYYGKDGKLAAKETLTGSKGGLYVILNNSLHYVLALDEKLFRSSLIQMLVFENYDKNLFEPVALTPTAKIYRLKI